MVKHEPQIDQAREEQTKEVVYMTWSSPGWAYKRRDKEFYRNIAAILFFLFVILIIIQEFMLVVAVLSIVFVIYVLSTVPPPVVNHRMTNKGLETGKRFYLWEDYNEYWFEDRWDQRVLVLSPQKGNRLIVLLGNAKEEAIATQVSKHLIFRQSPEKTVVERASSWLSDKVPLEKPTS